LEYFFDLPRSSTPTRPPPLERLSERSCLEKLRCRPHEEMVVGRSVEKCVGNGEVSLWIQGLVKPAG
jgi:hypothetical protein